MIEICYLLSIFRPINVRVVYLPCIMFLHLPFGIQDSMLLFC